MSQVRNILQLEGASHERTKWAGAEGFSRASVLKAVLCGGLCQTREWPWRTRGYDSQREQLYDGQRERKEMSMNQVKHSPDTHVEVPTSTGNIPPVAEGGMLQ